MLRTLSTMEDVQQTYDWFEQMRDTQPVWRDESSGFWHVFRYEDVNAVITDYRRFSSERKRPGFFTRGTEQDQAQTRSIIAMDPPQHRQYRNLVSSAFTPRAIDQLRTRVAEITQELLDEARTGGRMDFATEIAYPLPTIVIAELLGVPASDRPLFREWAEALLNRQLSDAEFFRPEEEQRDNPEMQRITRTFEEMSSYFRRMLEERKQRPREDMMSDLLSASVDGERLSMGDMISFCTILLLAGHVTTTNLLSQAIRCFDEQPEVLEQVRQQPALMPEIIEEVLRYASPVWRLMRITQEEVSLSGVTIPKDEMVFAWLASANRDAAQFADPERFALNRTSNKHIAFGHGVHFCIGAPLSRMEAAVALPMILTQLPNLRVMHEESPVLFKGRALFGFKSLPIAFDTEA